jgi:tRNA-specific adenosine deaminase 1
MPRPNAETETESATIINDVVSATLSQYAQLPFAPQPGKYTVLASFALHDDSDRARTAAVPRLLSLGTGAKCLPTCRLPQRGDALHDSHAEVIARRGAVRWLLEEVQRDARARGRLVQVCAAAQSGPAACDDDDDDDASERETETERLEGCSSSTWVCPRPDGLYMLRDGVHLWMYVSTVPCTSIPLSRLRARKHFLFLLPFFPSPPLLRILNSYLPRSFTSPH